VGSGFVVAHLPNGDWSAPAFFKWHAAGGGITLGARMLTSCCCTACASAGAGGKHSASVRPCPAEHQSSTLLFRAGISRAETVIVLNTDK
jgi:hypothetical protein